LSTAVAYAHSLPEEFPRDEWERLEEHQDRVATLAERFAGSFEAAPWGRLAGLWHDLGKIQPHFQDYIRGVKPLTRGPSSYPPRGIKIPISDGTTSAGMIAQSGGSGSISASRTYTAAGVYEVKLTVTDNDGASSAAFFQYVVIFDDAGGFVTGSGQIQVAAGSYAADPTLSGRAHFGFVSKYQRGATAPTGQTHFHFLVGDLRFFSTSYEWLVVSGAKAQFKGRGTINGQGDFGFLVTVIDGSRPGGGGVDRFRIKIWNKATGATVFDNQMGSSDNEDPMTALVLGNIRIQT
jgi:hypothetical protein